MRKKSLAKTTHKKLLRKAEELWKKCVRKRDGVCQICGSDQILQGDHVFSRTVKQLFLDISNGTLLCACCHTCKSYKVRGYEKKVDAIVLQREGADWWKHALETAFHSKPHKYTIDELEEKVREFECYLK